MSETATIHATTIVLGEAGILIRGEAGTGKSSLARQLIQEARFGGMFSRLVADDRTQVEALNDRLVARAVAPLAGAMEIRGMGIVAYEAEPAIVIRLVVDLSVREPQRMPDPDAMVVEVCGVLLPRIRAATGANITDIVMDRVRGLRGIVVTL